ncbi:hypothetical protein KCU92_g2919, partial [Aureobasidium melanogenum]
MKATSGDPQAIQKAEKTFNELQDEYISLFGLPTAGPKPSDNASPPFNPEILDLIKRIFPKFESDKYDSADIHRALQSSADAIDRTSQNLERKEKELDRVKEQKDEQLRSQAKLSDKAVQARNQEIERIKKEIEGLKKEKIQVAGNIKQLEGDSRELQKLRHDHDALQRQADEAERLKGELARVRTAQTMRESEAAEDLKKLSSTEERLTEATAEQSRLEEEVRSLQVQVSEANKEVEQARQRAEAEAESRSSRLEKEKQDADDARREIEAQLIEEKQAHGDSLKAVLTASITGEVIPPHIILSVLLDDVPLFKSAIGVTPGVTRNRLVPGGIIDIPILDRDFSNAELLQVLRATRGMRANSLNFLLWMDQNLIERLVEGASVTSEVYLAYALLFKVLEDSSS